jgi:hypothetical protein
MFYHMSVVEDAFGRLDAVDTREPSASSQRPDARLSRTCRFF